MYDLGLEAFLAVARTRNISKAAKQLNLAQPTVSKRLMVLEQQLGATLLERGHGVKLTPAGEAFVDLAERWDYLKQQIENFQFEGPKLALSIGTIDSISYSIFPQLYKALTQHRPKIKLDIITSKSALLYDQIERRQVDIAFCVLAKMHPTVVVEECYSEPLVLLCHSNQYKSQPKIVHPRELNPENELYVNWGDLLYQDWHQKWFNSAIGVRNHVGAALVIPALLQEPEKWTIVPLSVAQKALANGNLSISYISESPPDRKVYKLTHKNPKPSSVESLNIFNKTLDMVLKTDFTLLKY